MKNEKLPIKVTLITADTGTEFADDANIKKLLSGRISAKREQPVNSKNIFGILTRFMNKLSLLTN